MLNKTNILNCITIIFSNLVLDSPKPMRRFPSTEVPPSVLLSPYKQLSNGGNVSANTSPLVLQRFYHQQNQHHSR